MDINTKIKSILLVDDDEINNFYNETILRDEVGFSGDINVCYNGEEALDFLLSKGKYAAIENSCPDMILLDVNMPIMNGFEFLESYADLAEELKAKIVICMLTSSLNDSDKEKAKSSGIIKEYMAKSLDKDKLIDIINRNFKKQSSIS